MLVLAAVFGVGCTSSSTGPDAVMDAGPSDAPVVDAGGSDTNDQAGDASAVDAHFAGSATVSGALAEGLFSAADAVAYQIVWAGPDGGMTGGAALFVTQYSPACGGTDPANRFFLQMELYTPSATLGVGAYPVVYSGRLVMPEARQRTSSLPTWRLLSPSRRRA